MKIRLISFILYKVVMYIVAASIIYQSGSVFASNDSSMLSVSVTRMTMLIGAFILAVKSITKAKKSFVSHGFILFGICEILSIVNYLLYPASFLELQYKIVLLLLFYFIGYFYKNKLNLDIDTVFYNVIAFIAVITFGNGKRYPVPGW